MPMPQTLRARMRNLALVSATACIGVSLAVSSGLVDDVAAEDFAANAAKVLAFDNSGAKPSKAYRIAYLSECGVNPYCTARLEGLAAAAERYGFEYKIFDANFNPATQLKQVQNAVTEGFDGYLFAPTAAAPSCSMWLRELKPAGAPVVSLDLPMCEDTEYTEGLAGTVTMQRQAYYDAHIEYAFQSCGGEPCKVSAVGGFVGSDLFGFWENAIKKMDEKYPNVTVVSDQPANFDPRVALQKTQDALLAHPDIDLVVSSWDDMSRGVVQAIEAAGKKPGTDVRIYSIGATKDGVEKIKSGVFNETTALLPWEESYYAAVALIMALEGQPINGYVNEADLPRVAESTGTIMITKDNADGYEPNY